jgi:hypothetical protein
MSDYAKLVDLKDIFGESLTVNGVTFAVEEFSMVERTLWLEYQQSHGYHEIDQEYARLLQLTNDLESESEELKVLKFQREALLEQVGSLQNKVRSGELELSEVMPQMRLNGKALDELNKEIDALESQVDWEAKRKQHLQTQLDLAQLLERKKSLHLSFVYILAKQQGYRGSLKKWMREAKSIDLINAWELVRARNFLFEGEGQALLIQYMQNEKTLSETKTRLRRKTSTGSASKRKRQA